jgi:hypothetical protein
LLPLAKFTIKKLHVMRFVISGNFNGYTYTGNRAFAGCFSKKIKKPSVFVYHDTALLPSLLPMQDDKKNKLAHNFFFLGFVQIINVLLQLLVIPYVIKIIGIDGFGVVAVAQVVMLFLSAFTDYGFNQTATKDVSLNRADKTVSLCS